MNKREKTVFSDIALVDEGYRVREHQYMTVENGVITHIGDALPSGYDQRDATVIPGNNKAALPGFFNLHCHVPMVLMRGYGEGLPLQRWLQERMFPFEDLMTAEDMYWGSLLGMAEMLRSGAVSFSDMYMKLDGVVRALDQVGMKANLSYGTVAFDDAVRYQDTPAQQELNTITEYTQRIKNDPEKAGLVRADIAIHAEYTNPEKLVREVGQIAADRGYRLQVHLSETKSEHEECKTRRGGKTPARWFADCGVFDVPAIAAHCVWVEERDMEILAEKGVTAVHCPSSNLKLGSGIAPIAKMIDKGVRVAIGTDGAASNNNLNMLEEIQLASMVQKGANQDPLLLGPKQMLELACRNGALAQGREDCGALMVGNRADILLLDLDRPEMQPSYDMLSNVLYAAQSDTICMTMVDGRILYRNGVFPTIDMEQVLHNARRIREEKLDKLA